MKSEEISFFLAISTCDSITRSNLVFLYIENLALTQILNERFINVLRVTFDAQAIFLVSVKIVIFIINLHQLF